MHGKNPVYFGHIKSHSQLPGPMNKGNAKTDFILTLCLFLGTISLQKT